MTQNEHGLRSRQTGPEHAEREADFIESNQLASKEELRGDGVQSQRWVSTVKRFLDCGGDGSESFFSLIASSRLLKFLVVGGVGVIVNLVAMALLIQAKFPSDWRASAIASAVGALHNYLLNNHWTFSDRRRNGRALLNGAFLYFPMAAVGIAITTISYSLLSQPRVRSNFGTSSLYLLGAQLVSILFGTYFNYSLNKLFTWRLDRDEL
jgi:putative flippase GtrA